MTKKNVYQKIIKIDLQEIKVEIQPTYYPNLIKVCFNIIEF